VIRRISKNLGIYEGEAPAESRQLELDGYAVLRDVFAPAEVRLLRDEIDAAFAAYPP